MAGVLETIILELQQETRDVVGTDAEKLWSMGDWILYLNEAEREVARRTLCIQDKTTPEICQITLTDGTPSYIISPLIITIDDLAIPSWDSSKTVKKRSKTYMDSTRPSWRGDDSGEPTDFFIVRNLLTVYRTPSSDYDAETIMLDVKRLPKTDLSTTNTTPEVDSRYYYEMKLWALWRAFSKRDSQTLKDTAAQKLALFDTRVGPEPNLNAERIMKEQPASIQFGIYRR